MTTTEQELNEKLLKFAEIIWSNEYQSWLYPDGGYSDAPNFPHSLDACLEYLGPKFEAWEIYYTGYHNGIPRHRVIVTAYSVEYYSNGETPAMAFSRSVEQAIDKLEAK